jgi:ABC-type dipeptide/oligopeptide/nickel transport system permease subunit
MRRYSQISRHVGAYSDLPFWKKAAPMELLYVAYGLLVVALVVASYILGAANLLPHDPQEMDLQLLMAPPGTAGHLFGTDYVGRDILSRLIVGIQAYFLPGFLALGFRHISSRDSWPLPSP